MIPCVYIHAYQIIKDQGPGPNNSLCHADNRKYFSGLSNAKSKGSVHVLLDKESGKNLGMFLLRKMYIMINEFKYVQT